MQIHCGHPSLIVYLIDMSSSSFCLVLQDLLGIRLREGDLNSAINFQRLQVYSQSFHNLIQSTPTFRYILSQIKVSLVYL